MSDQSTRLGLPYLMPAQAQKHVTHNEALARLDLLVQLTVQTFGAATPPPLPQDGRVWALGPAPTGDWAGQAGRLAARVDGVWIFITPQEGWRAAQITPQGPDLRVFTEAGGWVSSVPGALDNLSGLGVNSAHDSINRLAVAGAATLLSHEGAGHQLKINKAAASDTASLLFQTGWSGRAEMGTAGDDGFAIKTSADGAAWTTALVASAVVTPGLPALSAPAGLSVTGLSVTGLLTGTAVTQHPRDMTAGRLLRTGDGGLLGDAVLLGSSDDLDTLSGNGFYCWTNSNAPLNAPQPAFGQLLHVQRSGASRSQLVLQSAGTQRIWIRGYTGGAWQPWYEVFHSRTVLAAVSQAGGVPTGGLIEAGSNANGDYVRFADGTQICTRAVSVSLAIGTGFQGGFRSAAQTWTFPAAFSAAPGLQVTPRNLTALGGTGANTPGTSSAQWAVVAVTTQTAATRDVSLTATGRWF
ncbi:MAG: DUF2793 domain-containing protein [Pseudorhodobacter sp.]